MIKIQTNTIFLLLLLFSTPPAALSQGKPERLRLIHADFLKRETIGQEVRQVLTGSVKFEQGKKTIECDLASQTIDEDPIALIGNVYIYDEEQSLFADTVYIYTKEFKLVAVGNVRSFTENDTTTANRMTYFQKQKKVISEGDVRKIDPKEKTILTGGFAVYQREAKYGEVFDHPVLIQNDSLGNEIMRILADTMEVFENGQRTIAKGNVEIIQPDIKATCGQAEYIKSESEITLTDSPKILQRNQQISGDTLKLYLRDSKLNRAVVTGNALAISDADTLDRGKWLNKLTGQTMEFFFGDANELKKVIIKNQATSLYHIIEEKEYKGTNEVSGDRITIELVDGQAQTVQVSSSPDLSTGKYSPPNQI